VFRISAIQKLKANHNGDGLFNAVEFGVPNISYSEIESKSQRVTILLILKIGVPNISYSEIESKSQQTVRNHGKWFRCSEYQLFRN